MQGINRWIGSGRLTADPVLRQTKKGDDVASFTMAVNRTDSIADFINIVVFGNIATNVARYVRKGNAVEVDGKLQMRKYKDKQGYDRTTYEVAAERVVFLESRQAEPEAVSQPMPNDKWTDGIDVSPDDLPF